MLKKILLSSAFFWGIFVFSQTNEPETVNTTNTVEIPDLELIKKKINLKEVFTKADTIPEFPGGIEAFKRKFFESIDNLDLKQKEKIDTRLYFVVEKNGYVRNVAAVGSNKKHAAAAELGVRRIFVRWKPAKLNGEPVRYLMYFPLTSKKYD